MKGRPKKKDPRRQQRQYLRWGTGLVFFLIVNLVLRLALMPLNQAEYTDGILQVTQFDNPTGIWPPLYTALVWPFALLVDYVWAGRFVSALMSAGAVAPLYLIARRSFGLQAALFTGLLYTISPVTLRWAPRVMTEATFSFFFWFACERLVAAQCSTTEEKANSRLLLAALFGSFAALTRYQGMMLLLPPIFIAIAQRRFYGFVPWRGLAAQCLYVMPVLWSLYAGNIHGTQFEERGGDNIVMTTILNAEAFLLLLPYFLTYPVALVVLIGLIKGRSRPRRMMKPLTIYVLIVLLIFQGAFGSFQERYLLPIIGLLLCWGGVGLAACDNILRKSTLRWHQRLRPWVPITTTIWSGFFALMVLLGSRQAWGDFRYASEFAGAMAEGTQSRLFTNEVYREERPGEAAIAATKAEYWTGSPVVYLEEPHYLGRSRLRPGDLLIMSNVYGAAQQVSILSNLYELELLNPQAASEHSFTATVIPVFPDNMSRGPGQSPIAWFQRYSPQPFYTDVYRVRGMKAP